MTKKVIIYKRSENELMLKVDEHVVRECWNWQTSTFQRRVCYARTGSTPVSRTNL